MKLLCFLMHHASITCRISGFDQVVLGVSHKLLKFQLGFGKSKRCSLMFEQHDKGDWLRTIASISIRCSAHSYDDDQCTCERWHFNAITALCYWWQK